MDSVNVSDLKPDQRNANKGTERGAYLLEKSLRQLGAGRSILVDKHNNIIAGNKTAETAVAIGLEKARIVETDGTELIVVKRTDVDIDSQQGRELALLDNKVSQVNLDFDVDVIASIAVDFDIDVDDLGFREEDNKTSSNKTTASETPTTDNPPDKPKDADTPITFALTPQQTAKLFKALETAQIENDITNGQGVANELALLVIVDEYLARRS